jgi:ferredoxin
MCILVNEAYEVLRDPEARRAYNAALDEALEDSSDGFDGAPLSKWCANTRMGRNADPAENRAAFVDELTCIGCKQCVWEAPGTFRIEAEHGRSRVFAQWVDMEDSVTAAIEACPVSCIHWVEKEDLPALEFVTRYKVPRVGVGLMMAGQGGAIGDVWDYTARYLKEREVKRAARARASRYSAAQAAARAAAAAAVAARQAGWFEATVAAAAERVGLGGNLGARVQDAMRSSMGEETSEDEFAAYARVGQRRRAARRAPGYGARGANGGRVPEERALVPAAEARPRWDRR